MDSAGNKNWGESLVGHERKLTTAVALTMLLLLSGCAPKQSERIMEYFLNMQEDKLVDYYEYVNAVNTATLGIGHVDLPKDFELGPLRELMGQRSLHSIRVLNWTETVLAERGIRSPASYAAEAVNMDRDQVNIGRFDQVIMETEQLGERSLDVSKIGSENLSVLYDAILTASTNNDVSPQLLMVALLYSGGNSDNPWGVPENVRGTYYEMADYVARYFKDAIGNIEQLPLDDPEFINSYLPYECWADYGKDISIDEKRKIVKFLALVEHYSNGDLGYGRTSYTLSFGDLESYTTLGDTAKQRVARFNALVRLGNGLTGEEISVTIQKLRRKEVDLSQQKRKVMNSLVSRRHRSNKAERKRGENKGLAVERSKEGQLARLEELLDAIYKFYGIVDNPVFLS